MGDSLTGGLKKVFFALIIGLSALTSFGFFVETFSLGRGFLPDNVVSIAINGLVGVLVLDGGALIWLRIYLKGADNNDLRAIASVGAGVSLIGAAITSFTYLIMVSVSSDVFGPEIRQYSTLGIAAIIIFHFILVFLFGYRATHARVDEKVSSLISEATNETLKLTEEYFRESIPALAKSNAQKLTDQLASQFASQTYYQEAKAKAKLPEGATTGEPSSNGHGPGSFLS